MAETYTNLNFKSTPPTQVFPISICVDNAYWSFYPCMCFEISLHHWLPASYNVALTHSHLELHQNLTSATLILLKIT